jgi:small subunit ribosomal protein S6
MAWGHRQRSAWRTRTWLFTSTCSLRARIWRRRKWTKTETWGLRSLAYRIAKNRKAHYIMLEIDAPGDTVAELERQAAINEDIIRYMTVRIEEAETGPSVMMRKQERDRERRADREGGRDGREGGAPRRREEELA